MASGPEEFISPIIKAMLANAEYQQNARKQTEEERSNKEVEKQKKDELKQRQDEHTDNYKQAQQRLDAEVAHLHALMDNEHAQNQRQARLDVQQGLTKPQDIPGTVGLQNIPGSDVVGPTGSFSTPQDATDLLANRTAAVTTATETAKAPFEAASREDSFKKAITVANIGQTKAEDVARIAADTKRAIDSNRLDYQNRLLDFKQQSLMQGNDGDLAAKLHHDIDIAGTQKVTSLTPKQKELYQRSSPPGQSPLDPKDSDSINAIPKVQDILDTATKLSKYSLFHGDNKVDALQGHFNLGGPRQQLERSLKSQIDALVPIFARVSRFTETTIRNQMEGSYSPTASPEENLKSVGATEKFFDDIINPILGRYSKQQATDILSARDIAYKGYTIPNTSAPAPSTPDWLKMAPATNKKGHKLSVEDSIREGQPVYQQ